MSAKRQVSPQSRKRRFMAAATIMFENAIARSRT